MRAFKLIPVSNLYDKCKYNGDLVLSFLNKLKKEMEISYIQHHRREIDFTTEKMSARICLITLTGYRIGVMGLYDAHDLTKQSEMDDFIKLLKTYER